MTDNDLKQIDLLLGKRFNKFGEEMHQFVKDEITDSEKRMVSKIEEEGKKTREEIGDFIHDAVLHQLDEKADKKDIARLEDNMERMERKLDNYSAQIYKNT